MNLKVDSRSLIMRSKRRCNDRAAFTSPVLTWLLVLAPTICLMIPLGISLWKEVSAKQFLQREIVKAEAVLSALPSPELMEDHSDLAILLTSAIRVLGDRKQFYGDENDPRVIAALVKDAAPLFKLIEQNIENESKAKLMGTALAGNYWLLEARFSEALNREDMGMTLETLRWSAKLSPPQANSGQRFLLHRWIDSIVFNQTSIEPEVLDELDSLGLRRSIDIEARNQEVLKNRKYLLLDVASHIASYQTFTDLKRLYREAESLERFVRPESLLQINPLKLPTDQTIEPFAYSLGAMSSDGFYFQQTYFYQFARSMEEEDQCRRLRLAIAARLQVMDTGKVPQSIDELASPDPKVPLVKSSIWGMPYQLTSWQIEVDGKTSDILRIHPIVNPSDSAARLWFSAQNPIVRLQPLELTLLLRETKKPLDEN